MPIQLPVHKRARRSALVWSHLPPRSTGRYWYREKEETEAEIVKVYKVKGESELSVRYGPRKDDVNYVENYCGQWAGPIPVPKEPASSVIDEDIV